MCFCVFFWLFLAFAKTDPSPRGGGSGHTPPRGGPNTTRGRLLVWKKKFLWLQKYFFVKNVFAFVKIFLGFFFIFCLWVLFPFFGVRNVSFCGLVSAGPRGSHPHPWGGGSQPPLGKKIFTVEKNILFWICFWVCKNIFLIISWLFMVGFYKTSWFFILFFIFLFVGIWLLPPRGGVQPYGRSKRFL